LQKTGAKPEGALRLGVLLTASALLVSALSAALAMPARADVPGDEVYLPVAGSPLAGITSSPDMLTPPFSTGIHDYALRCQTGVNSLQLTFTAASGGTIQAGYQSGGTLTLPVNLGENQAAAVEATDPANPTGPPAQYWIRCLPHDFPQIQVSTHGLVPPGYYLTSNTLTATAPNPPSQHYAMILDQNGTPVWYQLAPASAVNVELLANDTLAWAPLLGPGIGSTANGAYLTYQLDTQTTGSVAVPNPPGFTDPHELLQLANGHFLMIATPLLANVDLSSLGSQFASANNTIVDCMVEEVDPANPSTAVWSWDMSKHVSVSEVKTTPMLAALINYNGTTAADIYHCNSLEVDPTTGNVLLSSRNTNALYLINKSSGTVVWKLGGVSPNHDGAQILTIQNDPEGGISGQHDARFQSDGCGTSACEVSLYDDHTGQSGAARGVQYAINTGAGTATLDFSYAAPDGGNAGATGGFRRYSNGTDNLITWGFKPSTHSGYTEVDGSGNVLMTMTFPNGDLNYRAVKVPTSALNVSTLRERAGLPRPASSTVSWASLGGISTAKPAMASWGPGRLDVFVRGTDDELWHGWFTGFQFFGWEPLGGVLASGPTVAAWGPNRLDVFVEGTDGGMWHRWWDGTRWNGWEPLGGVLASGPTVASWGPNRLDVFVQGTDNGIWHRWWDGTQWNGWEGLGGQSSGDPAAASWGPGRVDVFTRNVDGTLGHLWYDGQWIGPEWFAGGLLSGPAAVSVASGQVDVVASGAAAAPLRFEYTGSWNNWQSLGGLTTFNPAIAAVTTSAEEVAVTGTDGGVWLSQLTTLPANSLARAASRTVSADDARL
jgi:hypothetical protein